MNMKQAIKLYNNSLKPHHFFEANTMNFFHSYIKSELINNYYFITEENDFLGTTLLYTVRKFSDDYSLVETVGTFQQYKTFQEERNSL